MFSNSITIQYDFGSVSSIRKAIKVYSFKLPNSSSDWKRVFSMDISDSLFFSILIPLT